MEKGRKEMSVGGGCGETDALAHRWREGEMTQPRWHVVRRLLEKLPAGLSCASSRALVGARRRELRARLRRDTCSLSSLQHSSQRPEWEQPLVLTDGWTGVGAPPVSTEGWTPVGAPPPPAPVWTDGWMHREIMARVHSAV